MDFEMRSFKVTGRRWLTIATLTLLGSFGALLAVSCVFTPAMLVVLAGWALLSGPITWNAVRSLATGEVELSWDGQMLSVRKGQGDLSVDIGPALWVFSDGSNIVIRSAQPLPKFNYGHVRSSGLEFTINGFFGHTPEGLSEVARQLGPAKAWLWRYLSAPTF